MKTLLSLCLFLLVFIFSGCASKVQITLLPEENGKVGTISLADNKGEKHTINKAYEALDISQKGEVASKQETQESITSKYEEVLKALPPKYQSHLFYFGFDKADLSPKQREELKVIAQSIQKGSIIEVTCIGHSDSTGDKEYNKILSLRRAKIVADTLLHDGVDQLLLKLQYYGDADPLVPSSNNKPNAKNRRVEIILK